MLTSVVHLILNLSDECQSKNKIQVINCMVMDGKSGFCGEHAVVCTEVEIECCTHETYKPMLPQLKKKPDVLK